MFNRLAEIQSRLRQRYAEPHRHYHTEAHIRDMLAKFETVRHLCEIPEAVELAIWYHDAIYDPMSKTNEADSADLLRNELSELVMPDIRTWAAALINATAKHQIPNKVADSFYSDCSLFLDIDLSILGASAADFDAYEDEIAREYTPHYPAEAYRTGRISVLENFLRRDRLFLSDHFHGLLEDKARANLHRSLGKLHAANANTMTP